MSDTADSSQAAPARSRLRPVLLGALGAALLGAGGFYATFSGIVALPARTDGAAAASADGADVAFIALEDVTVSLGPDARASHLRFSGHVEVAADAHAAVEKLRPRLLSVVNTYLRAVAPADLEDPGALIRLRAQILRRFQLVAGEARVRDFLITEFVLN